MHGANGIDSSEHADEYYLYERYQKPKRTRPLVSLYYQFRPLIPRSVQLALRRRYARAQAKVSFPSWPIESILVDKQNREFKIRLLAGKESRLPFMHYWPHGNRASVVLTHDVETAKGVSNIPRLRKLEQKYHVLSSWNFVPERYRFDRRVLQDLRDEGCEIGVHGLHHDGRLFSSRAIFEKSLPRINAYLREWDAVGFRSPSTQRNADWMPLIAAKYDSSFPDTDPFEPQPGGCCSIFPYFLGNMVELPITMPQDHTLFAILRQNDISIWKKKATWLIEKHGMVLANIHPDYMLTAKDLRYYEELLDFLTSRDELWYALPRDVAGWWRQRAESKINTSQSGRVTIQGPARTKGAIAWVTLDNGTVRYTVGSSKATNSRHKR